MYQKNEQKYKFHVSEHILIMLQLNYEQSLSKRLRLLFHGTSKRRNSLK